MIESILYVTVIIVLLFFFVFLGLTRKEKSMINYVNKKRKVPLFMKIVCYLYGREVAWIWQHGNIIPVYKMFDEVLVYNFYTKKEEWKPFLNDKQRTVNYTVFGNSFNKKENGEMVFNNLGKIIGYWYH